MQKRWRIIEADRQQIETLQKELRIHPALLRILVQRGINSYESAYEFFRPSMEKLHNPFAMKDMDKAVARIIQAVERNEKILIYGDYDVDGSTAVALLYLFLKNFYSNFDYYVPHRKKEGYGISFQGIDYAASHNFSLIIALDCGIRAEDKVNYARSKGIDIIICDHHLPGEILPAAVAVLDPKRNDCDYPYKELSGCGIGFKLIQALSIEKNIPLSECFKLVDLVCVSIAADIVPITGENRILAYHGLKKLNSDDALPGIKLLKEIGGIYGEMDIEDAVFVLAPRINAAGRLDDARHAVKLLIGEAEEEALDHAIKLNQLNYQRKNIDRQITLEALAMIEADEGMKNRKTTVVYNSSWHKGVIGIVASRLTESYYRPTIVLTEQDGILTGSARSVKDFNLYEAIRACSEHLIQFGGHHFAAGLSLYKENLQRFTEAFEAQVAATIHPDMLIPEVEIDAEIGLQEVNENFYGIIKRMAPFGPGNMKPTFMIKNLTDSGYSTVVKDEHLRIVLKHNNSYIKAIAFGMSSLLPVVQRQPFDLAFHLDENIWNDQRSIQLTVKDIRPAVV
ncbi:MAG: single-stranded-DNA-specific exonuclease RecJ [Chitinophagales bacterium]|nr:single-stranded-DNA-specific exonuclease RecJ [Chitinophagales bacterium]MDW8273630.1 single-stranded-DNA-specific exonuclease RecJ [Chitinophagales bacterium]